MRVNTKVVIDIASGNILERESYEWSGPVAYAGGKGGSSGSTTTTYQPPSYIQPYLETGLKEIEALFGSSGASTPPSVISSVDAALGPPPKKPGKPVGDEDFAPYFEELAQWEKDMAAYEAAKAQALTNTTAAVTGGATEAGTGLFADPTSIVPDFTPETEAAIQALQDTSSGIGQESVDYLSSVLAGDYLFGGEAFDAAYEAGKNEVLPDVMSLFGGGPQGGLAQVATTEALGDVFAGLYDSERARQQEAAALAPGVAAGYYDPLLSAASITQGRENDLTSAPYDVLAMYTDLLGPYMGAPTTTINASDPQTDWLSAAAGGALTGFGIGGPIGAGVGGGLGLLGAL